MTSSDAALQYFSALGIGVEGGLEHILPHPVHEEHAHFLRVNLSQWIGYESFEHLIYTIKTYT